MKPLSFRVPVLFGIGLFLFLGNFSSSVRAQGVLLRAVSSVNEGMGGVATATPVDTLGAISANPATISAFEKSDISFGTAVILADSSVESSFMGMKGETSSDSGAVPAPYMGALFKNEESPFTFGFGFSTIGGAQTNYQADPSNPILNKNFGMGRTSAKVEIFEMAPTVSYQLTDRLSIGFAPSIVIGRVIAEPLFFGPTDAAGHWCTGAGTRYIWGAGFQTGLFYKGELGWNWGLSYKSPRWCEKCPYNLTLDGVNPEEAFFEISLPAIYSVGLSYSGWERLILGADLRYLDYSNTKGLTGFGFNEDGSIVGLGWESVFAISTGAQYRLTDRLTLRAGYSFNENPVDSSVSYMNVPCPVIIQHGIHCGFTVALRNEIYLNLAYAHMFATSVSGPLPKWSLYDPNSYVKNTAGGDSISVGINKNF